MNDVIPLPTKAVLKSGGQIMAIIPQTIEESFRLAEAFCVAGMVPDSYKGKTDKETASKVMLGILKSLEVGLPPLAGISNIYIINNRPSVYGDGALAIVQGHRSYAGHKEWYEGVEGQDSWIAKIEVYRKGINGEIQTYPAQFSWHQAKTAGLTRKGPWTLYPGRMLKMRARAFGLRDSFSDALVGLSIAEEMLDVPQKAAEVATNFLDVAAESPSEDNGESVAIETAAVQADPLPGETAQPIHEQDAVVPLDPKQLFQAIKKNFIQAGDDKERIKQVIDAAEGLALPDPFGAELTAIINAKKTKVDNG